jgi:hypothetical protein
MLQLRHQEAFSTVKSHVLSPAIAQQLKDTPELEDNYEERGRGLKIISAIADSRYCLFISKSY